MKNVTKNVYLFSVIFIFSLNSYSQKKVAWPESTNEMKPWIRWHWMGNAVDRKNITRELQEMAEAGIGGVDVESVYGVQGEEHRYIKYLSPEFTEILKFTISQAHKLGMGIDIGPGAGWTIGGYFVPKEKGLVKLKIHRFELKIGESWQLPDSLEHVCAISFLGEDRKSIVLSPGEKFTSPSAGIVYVAEGHLGGMKVKVPSPGGEGLVIDPLSKEITEWYLKEFWRRIGLDDGLIRSVFHDSFEYYGADFTLHFMKEFKKRRGYDLTEYLYVLAGDSSDEEIVKRIRSDYRETVSDLLTDAFIKPMRKWANSHKSRLRNQAHGSPGNILDIYAASDIPETEKYGPIETNMKGIPIRNRVAIFTNKFASSAAHVTGQKLISSESFTWLKDNWTVTSSDMMQATNRLFLAGVNHMFFNNGCYSPEDAEWPGWLVYAATQMNNRNPLWRELPALFNYIKRSQSILQNATPQNDLLVYWPFYDVAAKELEHPNYTNIDKGDDADWFKGFPCAKLSEKLMNEGYTFDYISDKQLLNSQILNGRVVTSSGAAYRAVVLPKVKYIPLETMQRLEKFIALGGKVFFDESLPESVPGMFQLSSRLQKLKEIKSSLDAKRRVGDVIDLLGDASIDAETSLMKNGFHYLKMKMDNEDWYMLFNCDTLTIDAWVNLNSDAKAYALYYPENGKISRADKREKKMHIQLEPERIVFVRCYNEEIAIPNFSYMNPEVRNIEIKGLWNIRFLEGGPTLPDNITTDRLDSWTSMGSKETRRFSGTARYAVRFNWNKGVSSALLDLGDVKDCARVKVNGKVLGSLLGPTYKIKVDNLVQGENLLEVEVTNIAANRIRDLDIRGITWKKFRFYHMYGGTFDASKWPIREAGLLGPVLLQPLN